MKNAPPLISLSSIFKIPVRYGFQSHTTKKNIYQFREIEVLFQFTADHFLMQFSRLPHFFYSKKPVCFFVPFQEQRYFRVLNAAKRSRKFEKKSPPLG